MPRAPSDWISLAEAASILAQANVSVSRSTLGRWVAAGRLQSIRPGRRIYVRRGQIRAMLKPARRSISAERLQGTFFDEQP